MQQLPLITLIAHVPGRPDRRLELASWRTVLGRSSRCDIQVVARQISKRHAAIEVVDGIASIRDLGSKNGVEVNGDLIPGWSLLHPGDHLVLGEAHFTVDPNSLVFQPRQSRSTLFDLLDEQEELKARVEREEEQYRRSRPMRPLPPPPISGPVTRQALVLMGRPLHIQGAPPILRVLRLADERGARDSHRVAGFRLETEAGDIVWVKPWRDVRAHQLESFPMMIDPWFDEPEDFAPTRTPAILTRDAHYLPNRVKLTDCASYGHASDGLRIFSEASPEMPIQLYPL